MGTFFYMLLAFLVGVLVGWFIWGRLRGELDSLRGDLDRTRSERDRLRADSDRLTGELDACGRARADLERRLGEQAPTAKAATAKAPAAKTGATKAAMQAPSTLMSTSAPAKPAPKKSATAKAATAPRASAAKTATQKPPVSKASAAPRTAPAASKAAPIAKKAATGKATATAAGKANDLRRLIGIGPTNERLLKGLGVTTYAQIAAWTPDDVKRIEATLNFDGRIERERWIEQAKLLAAGDEKEFARRFPTAGEASNT
ncbi:proton-conducting membrane transporter [Mesorhizobium sp. M1027]|uniref:proton-conducting membrane transporter n=1 Tax=Mesorhizobium sp. M1027 TaxID=2957050 RepID=UPI00333D99CA